MSPRVLVTGASGFVGRDLVVRLAEAGWRVRAAARRTAAIPAGAAIEPVPLTDLADPAVDWAPLLAGVTHVVHLAAIAQEHARVADAAYAAINIAAAASLAAAARARGVTRLVLVSSVRAQSGPAAMHVLSAADPPLPADRYGRSKLAGERAVAAELAGTATGLVVLRPPLIYGKGVGGNIGALIRLARWPLPLPLAGLDARRSILSLANLASAIRHALEAPGLVATPYLVADADAMTAAEIITALRQGLDRPPGLVTLPQAPTRWALSALRRDDIWQRLAGRLELDTCPWQATGWSPVEQAHVGLAAAMRSTQRRS